MADGPSLREAGAPHRAAAAYGVAAESAGRGDVTTGSTPGGSTLSDPPRILVVDDQEDARWALATLVQGAGWAAVTAATGEEALTRVRHEAPAVVLLDVCLPDMDGFEVLTRIKATARALPVVMLTAYGGARDAVRAIRAGACDYLTKPFRNDDVLLTVRQALTERAARIQVRQDRDRTKGAAGLVECMGDSQAVRRIVREVERVATTKFSVLLIGETGTGKELVARAIHAESPRAGKPFVAIDCGAIPEPLIESELFGHEKGAFTGAHQTVAGAFELADGGTIFLDEIGNLPLSMQAKLLRVLEERRIHRVGSPRRPAVDFRVVAATNVDLHTLVQRQAFRQDLYHRLAQFTITLPPLRERKEDLPFLVRRFLQSAGQEVGKAVQGLSAQALDLMLAYDWPGNVRELHNQVRRAVLLVDNPEGVITSEHLGLLDEQARDGPEAGAESPIEFDGLDGSGQANSWCGECPLRLVGTVSSSSCPMALKALVKRVTAFVERHVLQQALQRAKGNKAEVARLLHLDYKTVHTKCKSYRIVTQRYEDPVSEPERLALGAESGDGGGTSG